MGEGTLPDAGGSNPVVNPDGSLDFSSGRGSDARIPRKQYGVAIDLLAAGEIHGIVGGLNGVYLNGAEIVEEEKWQTVRPKVYSGYNSAGALLTFTTDQTVSSDTALPQYGIVRGGMGSFTTNASSSRGETVVYFASDAFTAAQSTHSVRMRAASIQLLARIVLASGDLWVPVHYIHSTTDSAANYIRISSPLMRDVPSGTTVHIDWGGLARSRTDNTIVFNNIRFDSLDPITFSSSSKTNIRLLGGVNTVGDSDVKNFKETFVDYRKGSRFQKGPEGIGSAPAISFVLARNDDLAMYNGIPNIGTTGLQSTGPDAIINTGDFDFGQSTLEEIDIVQVDIEFPGGMLAVDKEGDHFTAFVDFQVIFEYKNDAAQDWNTVLVAGKDYGGDDFVQDLGYPSGPQRFRYDQIPKYKFSQDTKAARSSNAFVAERAQRTKFLKSIFFDVTRYQPFTDWRIKVRRLVPSDPTEWWSNNNSAAASSKSILKNVTVAAKERLMYPMSAYAVVGFSAQDFPTPPKRSYKIKGKKIRVPTNYFTRDERRNIEAKYTRNKSTGADTSSYVTWDGTFRGDPSLSPSSANYHKVYCNNPAWIFYDILTDKEVGLGEFIQESDIDIYGLYQIARYCDELVSDGKGGLEPRFTCNVYFAKKKEAYKVLKDLASTFRSMMYWIDGKVSLIQDKPKEAVYTFTTGNVKDGMFNYTYTGDKARTNQVRVAWNNPKETYKQTILTVDDLPNIAQQGNIIAKDVVAFGCTSESQARRVGLWHLETDTRETEIITFNTGLNAAYLRPGDIINVQDKRQNNIIASGRVSAGSTSTSIVLDRTVTFPGGTNGTDCNLYLIYDDPGIYLQEETATINSTSYSRGELIQTKADGTNILTGATQEDAANFVDDSGNVLNVQFTKNSRVEVEAITNSGSSASTITTAAFAGGAPAQDTIWAISREDDVSTEDIKEYRIAGISEIESNEYEITATQYTREKFDEIEVDRPVVTDDFVDVSTRSGTIPVPEEVILVTGYDSGLGTFTAEISWGTPTESFTDSAGTTNTIPYRFLQGYVISHNFSGNVSSDSGRGSGAGLTDSVYVPGTSNSYTFFPRTAGTYTVSIRTVNDVNETSRELVRTVEVIQRGTRFESRVSEFQNITALAGSMTHSSGTITVSDPVDISTPQATFTGVTGGDFDFTSMGNSAEAFLFFDTSGTPALRSLLLHTDGTTDCTEINAYLKEVGASTNGLSAITGEIDTITEGSARVLGNASTTFTSDFAAGDLIKFSTSSAAGTEVAASEYKIVTRVDSDRVLFVDTVFQDRGNSLISASNIYAFKQAFKPDHAEDALVARLTTDAVGAYTFEDFIVPTTRNATRNEFRGVYSGSTAYSINDIVTYNGITYIALQDTTGNAPTGTNSDNAYWAVFSPPGEDGLTLLNSRQAVTLPASSAGVVSSYTNSGTTIQILEGSTQLDYDGLGNSAGHWTVSVTQSPSSTITVGSLTDTVNSLVVGSHSAMSNSTDSVEITYNITGQRLDGTSFTLTANQSIAKSKSGADGVDGTPGSDGVDARAVSLTPGTNIFTYNSSGASPSPSTTTVTATAFNTNGTVYYDFSLNGTSVQNTTTSTYTYTPQANSSNMPDEVKVEIREGSSSSTVLATDQISLGFVQPGATGADGVTGGDGVDAITTFYSNQAHTVPVTNTGTETWTGSGGELNVFDGTTELILNSNTQTASYPGTNGRYNLNITPVSGDTLTEGAITGSGTVGATIGDFSGNLTQATQYEVSIYVTASDGTQYNPKFKISFAPSDQGSDGATGATGAPGATGDTGADGLRTIQGYLYYEKTTAGAPSAPSGTTYTFSTGVVSGTGINDSGTTDVWKNSPNTQDATSTNTFYTVRYYGTEASAGSSTITVSYSSVVQQTSFTGVVTFSGGTFNETGSGAITTIDGSNITTGSIQSANYVDNGSSDFSTSGSKFDLSNNVVETKYFYSNESGAGFSGTVTVGGTDLTENNTINANTISAGTFRNGFEPDVEFGKWSVTTGHTISALTSGYRSGTQAANIVTTTLDTVASGTVGGAYIEIPTEVMSTFAGRTIEVSIWARVPSTNGATSFQAAYSTNAHGNSGWQSFTPTTAWARYSFQYEVSSANTLADYLGIQGDGAGNNLYIDDISIAIVTLPDDVGLEAISLTASGTKTLTFTGNRISVSGTATSLWDTDAVSTNAFNTGFVSFKLTETGKSFFIGLNSDPDNNDSFNTLDYAWYIASSTARVRKNGSTGIPTASPETTYSIAVGDVFSITFDGFAFRFYQNGTLRHTEIDPAATTPLYFDSSFFSTDFDVDAVQFGPIGYSDYGAAGSPIPGINWGGGSWNIEMVKDSDDGVADSNIGEIWFKAGSYVLPDNSTRVLSSNAGVTTQFEGSIRPNDRGATDNVFYIIWGATNPDSRFADVDWGDETAEAAGLFAAVYNRESKKWYAVPNTGTTTYEFTPEATDYVIATGVKTSTSGGIDRLTPTVALADLNSRVTPYGALRTYFTSSVDVFRYYPEEDYGILHDFSGTGETTIGMAFPAFRVNEAAGETYAISVPVKANVADADGCYIRVYEYDGSLPDGKLAVSHNASTGDSRVQEDTRAGSTSPTFENQGLGTDWSTFETTYTPTSSAQWASIVVLNWTGMGNNELHFRQPEVSLNATNNGDKINTDGNITGAVTLSGGSIAINKTSAASTTSGIWLGTDGSSNYDFHIGNASQSLRWDGSAGTMDVVGTITVGSGSSFDASLDLSDLDSSQNTKLNGVATGATNNGSTINTSGNVSGAVTILSGGTISVGNITIDGTNNRILITD